MKEVWDKKAKTFPRYIANSDEDKPIFEYFKNAGIDFSGKNVLDLGCGNGRYALALAQNAKNVLCFDISPNMLENVKADAKKHGFSNIHTFCGDWGEFDIAEFGEFRDKIDIVFASLTPALNSFEKFEKAYNLAKEAIMYIGWGRKRENAYLNAVFKAHNAEVALPTGAMNVTEYLESLGLEVPPVHFITKTIHHRKTLESAVADASWQLEAHEVTPNIELIKEVSLKWREADYLNSSDLEDSATPRVSAYSSDSVLPKLDSRDSLDSADSANSTDSSEVREFKDLADSRDLRIGKIDENNEMKCYDITDNGENIVHYKSIMEIGIMAIRK
ncbi:hypothetical protein CCY99_06360 [Helicobacter sp. 16-1353]|uniref:class I SAM-dependent methyltransferase n=1 Tax=Helicobacter sp. 16-1353 TaxID=2004996 RepID=UPI000DCC6404|nr:class I SAM-dependent methyltransferase [Helicobacter sp. 16-1353]RAX52988.1 hypothetical protein CCY99_06360 [Helicobacter sp. 16-1353]